MFNQFAQCENVNPAASIHVQRLHSKVRALLVSSARLSPTCNTAQVDVVNRRRPHWKICRAGFANPTSRETNTSNKLLRFHLSSNVFSRAS